MKTELIVPTLIFALVTGVARAEEPDAELIARITGLKPEVKNGVAKVSVPRADLSVVADGVKMTPFQGLTSWGAFERGGCEGDGDGGPDAHREPGEPDDERGPRERPRGDGPPQPLLLRAPAHLLHAHRWHGDDGATCNRCAEGARRGEGRGELTRGRLRRSEDSREERDRSEAARGHPWRGRARTGRHG